jgi:general stress protein YciG
MPKGISKKRELEKAASRLGKSGGDKTKERLKDDPEYYRRIGRLGGQRTKRLIELGKKLNGVEIE